MMTADMIDAHTAEKYGLVNHVVEQPHELMPKARELMRKIIGKAPLAIGMVIASANSVDENGYQVEANSFANCCRTSDF